MLRMCNRSLKQLVLSIVLVLATCFVPEHLLGQTAPKYDRVAIDSLDADG